jgi:hypothetical protein
MHLNSHKENGRVMRPRIATSPLYPFPFPSDVLSGNPEHQRARHSILNDFCHDCTTTAVRSSVSRTLFFFSRIYG